MAKESVYLKDWKLEDDLAKLTYSDGDVVSVSKTDFNRAFGPIISASKEAVIRDFAVDANEKSVKPALSDQIKSAEDLRADKSRTDGGLDRGSKVVESVERD